VFGHNCPEILKTAEAILQTRRPFHAQASVRGTAGLLAQRLAARLQAATGRDHVVTLTNSGAETVEAAIKHAELERKERHRLALERVRRHIDDARMARSDGRLTFSPDFLAAAGETLGANVTDSETLFAILEQRVSDMAAARPRFLALAGAFHGKTSGALQLTHNESYRAPWTQLGPDVSFVPENDTTVAAKLCDDARDIYFDLTLESGAPAIEIQSMSRIAACFVEPIQGEGGIREVSRETLETLSRLAAAHGFPLIIDEIQTGMGRTGTFLAIEQAGNVGDYVLLSKALGGGIAKVGALAVRRDRYLPEFGYLHSSTFAEDDFSSGIALRALELLDEDSPFGNVIEKGRAIGQALKRRLDDLAARYPHQLIDIRGRGLMLGLELGGQDNSPSVLLRTLDEQGLLGYVAAGFLFRRHAIRVLPTLSSPRTLRLEPSAHLCATHVEIFCRALADLLELLERGDAEALLAPLSGRTDSPPRRELDPPPVLAMGTHRGQGNRIGFLCHFMSPADLKRWDPCLSALSDSECETLLDRVEPVMRPVVIGTGTMTSICGASTDVTMIGIPFRPERVMDSLKSGQEGWALDLIADAIDGAQKDGCHVIGFGGYTSIVTDNCMSVVTPGIATTSGNSLTAAAALEATLQASKRLPAGPRVLGIVGAAGNIGAVLAEVAAPSVDRIVLVGRRATRRRLEQLSQRLRAHSATPVDIATDMDALRSCNLVISATNSPAPVLLPAHIGEQPVVICDVAVPQDVDLAILDERPNAIVLRGGVIRAPLGQTLPLPGADLRDGELYACLAETILLGLADIRTPFSRGPLAAKNVRRILELAHEHGFEILERRAEPVARDKNDAG
jgi:acetylornithine/succinyldiaminopimelate/putrescine aminotransferase/predicted amino acid dehydrogenase